MFDVRVFLFGVRLFPSPAPPGRSEKLRSPGHPSRGDGLGFDVLSFETTGRERLIEVKTTAYGASTPFFVTRNEVDASRDAGDQFHLYRPFNFRRQPRLFAKQGPIEQAFSLEASQFKVTIA